MRPTNLQAKDLNIFQMQLLCQQDREFTKEFTLDTLSNRIDKNLDGESIMQFEGDHQQIYFPGERVAKDENYRLSFTRAL